MAAPFRSRGGRRRAELYMASMGIEEFAYSAAPTGGPGSASRAPVASRFSLLLACAPGDERGKMGLMQIDRIGVLEASGIKPDAGRDGI